MDNKKGVSFLGGHIVNLVIAVIVIFFLVYLGTKIYGSITTDNEFERANSQLESLSEVVLDVQQNGEEKRVEYFTVSGWNLMTLPVVNYPVGDCLRNEVESCLCICDNINCDNRNVCKGFKFEVKLNSITDDYAGFPTNRDRFFFGKGRNVENVLSNSQSVYGLDIFKTGDDVVIRNEDDE